MVQLCLKSCSNSEHGSRAQKLKFLRVILGIFAVTALANAQSPSLTQRWRDPEREQRSGLKSNFRLSCWVTALLGIGSFPGIRLRGRVSSTNSECRFLVVRIQRLGRICSLFPIAE